MKLVQTRICSSLKRCWPLTAPPACEIGFQCGEEFFRLGRLLREEIRGLAGIGAEVVELEFAIRAFAGGLDEVVRVRVPSCAT